MMTHHRSTDLLLDPLGPDAWAGGSRPRRLVVQAMQANRVALVDRANSAAQYLAVDSVVNLVA